MRRLVVGNWKMNGMAADLGALGPVLEAAGAPGAAEAAICPPATLIAALAARVAGRIGVGGQDCHAAAKGAHTGEISAPMLIDAGATLVILGHSERRRDRGEDDAAIGAKIAAAQGAGLRVILCVGETEAERDAGRTGDVVSGQFRAALAAAVAVDPARFDLAYEPVWAIGTGRVPAMEDIAAVHAQLGREIAAAFGAAGQGGRILYGGSVTAANAAAIFAVAGVGGALVGGASLKPAEFAAIIRAA